MKIQIPLTDDSEQTFRAPEAMSPVTISPGYFINTIEIVVNYDNRTIAFNTKELLAAVQAVSMAQESNEQKGN